MIMNIQKDLRKIKAIIFDMDGVITNTMPEHFLAWQEVLKKEGIEVSRYDIYSREGQRGITSIKEIFSSKDKVYDDAKARELLSKKEELFKKIVQRRFIDGSENLLKWLKNQQLQLALVTGTSRQELYEILPDDIYHLFSVVVTGDDVHNGKPHPEPYRLALTELKINSSDALVIENAPLGIQSAKAAGIICLAIETSLSREHLKEADCIFDSIEDLHRDIKFLLIGN